VCRAGVRLRWFAYGPPLKASLDAARHTETDPMRTISKRLGASVVMVCAGLVMASQPPTTDPKPDENKVQPTQPGQEPKGQPTDKIKMPSESRMITLVPTKWLDDNSVRGTSDEKLGEVKDLIISRQVGRVKFVLLGHGGVATIGEKVTAVPYSAFTWDSTKKWLALAMTSNEIKSAPSLESGEWKTLGDPATAEPIYAHYKSQMKNMDRDMDMDRHNDMKEPSKLDPSEHRVLRVSDIRGKTLIGSDGKDAGTVHDLVIDANSGRIAFVAVTFGGVVGIGSEKVAVPWTLFDVNKDGKLFAKDIDKEAIKAAPRLKESNWGELKEPGFGAKVYQHYGKQAEWLENEKDGR
jgi:sporulation protein YlmC with PRC-barrel domain